MTTNRDPLPLERLGDYEVLAPISEGGMGSVWLGRPTARPTELVALKVIRAEHGQNKEFVAMLIDEAAIASRLLHPNILPIRSLRHDGTRHFLVMDLQRGHTLLDVGKTAHARGMRLPHAVVAWIGARVADALHYAHDLKDDGGAPLHIVHRDVNPANIFVTREGVPKLIDFGLAKARDRIASTAIGVVKGKLAYLAPEQARGKAADRRSDIFALGVMLWEITLDRRLFHDDSDVQTVRRVLEAEVPDPTMLEHGYPRALADVLVRALAKEPGERWQTAADLRDALDAYVASSAAEVDAARVRGIATELFAGRNLAEWERLADDVSSEQERTRIWEDRKEDEKKEDGGEDAKREMRTRPIPTEPLRTLSLRAPPAGKPPGVTPAVIRLAVVAGGCAVVGGVLVGALARGCHGSNDAGSLEPRVARIEDLLGIADAGTGVTGSGPALVDAGAVVSLDDRSGGCALAKVAAYQAWQEAMAKAKANAAPAEAACAEVWSDSKKQACYYAAMAQIRATQGARDVVIAGGAAAHEAVKATKEDPKNEAIARARTLSHAAFASCDEDGG